jgi:hypothetical protein
MARLSTSQAHRGLYLPTKTAQDRLGLCTGCRLLYSGRMQPLDIFATVAGICAFGLALYEAIGKGEYAASGVCFGFFILCSVVLLFSRKAAQHSGKGGHVQRQRSGHNSTNIQAGRDVNIGGDKDGR